MTNMIQLCSKFRWARVDLFIEILAECAESLQNVHRSCEKDAKNGSTNKFSERGQMS